MEPHTPPAPSAATYPPHPSSHHPSHSQRSPAVNSDSFSTQGQEYRNLYNEYNEKAADPRSQHGHHLQTSSPPSQASSLSSSRKQHASRQEIQHSPQLNHIYPPRAHLDTEKGNPSPRVPSGNGIASNPDVTTILYDSGDYNEKGPEEKPVQLLLFLSGPCALLSFVITIWTMFSLFIALVLQPFRLCSKRPSLSSQLTTFLAPPLNLQLRLIYSYSPTDYAYRTPMLVAIHLFSPIVAIGVAIGAWTSAFFWFFSVILGDTAGQDGHNDGKDSLLGVRSWWDRWLSRGLREE